ncbi:iron-sulfur cluster carrier protein ApbC [Brumicola pallidula]|uniref:Iron-sulfur cluster carrier protein n=1 Tax=Brumicola pallidula DSM 14239 = ACAM 615 TaxID=1121922 RepID=K6YXC8_9ALTE|nr:iron-sulfur cluster carrier protein ApbC [Glaciecola pallidula]GAC28646.1 ATP-binding protein involved in chromosome partitioning [Glaciecola pallidula DSM 14239 = ACAM 615]
MFFSKNKRERIQDIEQAIADYYAVDRVYTKTDAIVVLADPAKYAVGKKQTIEISLGFTVKSTLEALKNALQQKLPNIVNCNIDISFNVPITQAKVAPIPNVKNVIAVSSGKGGVGKSATSVNLAYALQKEGARVGILDADIYGPSVPIMLGNPQAHPDSKDNRTMYPLMVEGIAANSIGYLVDGESASIWRGPMATKALKQLIYETKWPLLDYLIVDLPPGTGDIHLTLSQQVPLSAAVIVTTPQTIATADAKKGIAMFEKLAIPVLGIVENMSYFECKCGEKSYPFSQGGSVLLAEQHGTEVLGELPLSNDIREHADNGKPVVNALPDSNVTAIYQSIARKVSIKVGTTLQPHQLTRDKTAAEGKNGVNIQVVNKS